MGTSQLSDFIPYIQSDVPGIDIPTLERNLRLTLVEFCEKTWVLQKGITFVVDTEDIDSDMFESVAFSTKGHFRYHRPFAIDILRINGQEWGLTYVEMVNDSAYVDSIRQTQNKIWEIYSTYFIRLAPFQKADEIYLKVVFKPLLDMTYVDDRLLNDWVEAIAAGTKMRLLDIPDKPWTNHPASNRWERKYRSKISDARRQLHKQHTGAPGHVHPRTFGLD